MTKQQRRKTRGAEGRVAPAAAPGPADSDAVLVVRGLRRSFRSPEGDVLPIVHVEEFSVARGAQVALRGGSGTGKTTFLNLVAGILRPDAGTIAVDGAAMSALPEAGRDALRARAVGYVFQTFNLLQGYSALENVMLAQAFGRGVDRPAAVALLERVGLAGRLHHRPRELSVGQQQRVAVARSLANRPPLVLADEPTGSLDRHHAAAALALLRGVCAENGAALLLVSHDAAILEQFERVEDFETLNRALAAHAARGMDEVDQVDAQKETGGRRP